MRLRRNLIYRTCPGIHLVLKREEVVLYVSFPLL